MCGVKSEVKEEEKLKVVRTQQEKEEKKDSANSDEICCEPLCPDACG